MGTEKLWEELLGMDAAGYWMHVVVNALCKRSVAGRASRPKLSVNMVQVKYLANKSC